jgi:glycosyltransferase involved in cell wall biosynthesis
MYLDAELIPAVPAAVGEDVRSQAPRVCIVHEGSRRLTLPFIQAHLERLPGRVTLIHDVIPAVDGRPLLAQHWLARASRYAVRRAAGRPWEWEFTAAYLKAFRRLRPDAVLAEWGTVATRVVEACRIARVPLIAHFHGYDASVHSILAEYANRYRVLFRDASAVIAVSRAMRRRLIDMGAPAEKVHYNNYGVDCRGFCGGSPADARPVFLAVGRFVEKKAPQLTLAAFADVIRTCPAARLRMVGEGPLLGVCRDGARRLRIDHAVEFLGARTTPVIQEEMRKARCFVQHSIEASDGDCEGTPNVILEAGASGLPVVSTRHGGIPDAVVEGETGFLVDENDVSGMARDMTRLALNAELAGRIGAAARRRIETEFSVERSIAGLWGIITNCLHRTGRQDSAA